MFDVERGERLKSGRWEEDPVASDRVRKLEWLVASVGRVSVALGFVWGALDAGQDQFVSVNGLCCAMLCCAGLGWTGLRRLWKLYAAIDVELLFYH